MWQKIHVSPNFNTHEYVILYHRPLTLVLRQGNSILSLLTLAGIPLKVSVWCLVQ